MHVHVLLTFHLPRCHRALRAPLKPLKAVQRIYRDNMEEKKHRRDLQQLRVYWRSGWDRNLHRFPGHPLLPDR